MLLCSAGLAFCTLITTMRLYNRVQWKSLMYYPSVASEIQSDRVVQTGEFLLTSLKQSKVSRSLCLIYSYDARTSVGSEHLACCNEAGAAVARPGKVVGSVLRYNNCGAATGVEAIEQQQRRMVRNPAGAAQYPKRTPQPCKSNRGDEDSEGSSRLKQNPQYIPQKVGGAQDTATSRWY